jgi:N-acetylglucosaminyl-diphospho-decaprenol L-rhamnosyltransferase
MSLSVIILNFNKSQLTINCLKSLYKQLQEEISKKSIDFIIVDNASNKDELELLKDGIEQNKFNNIKLIQNTSNAGFSKGCNLGAKSSKGDILLFLNNDTEINDNRLWEMAIYLEKNEKVSILGGKLINPDGTEQQSAGKYYTIFNALMLLLGVQRVGIVNKNPNVIKQVDWVKGACLMIKKEVFESLSGFDENMFMYIEDMELCYRAKKSRFRVFFYPYVTIVHKDHGSSNREFAIVNIYQNLLYFYKKHRPNWEYLFLKSILKIKAWILIIFGKVTKNSYLINTYEKAIKVA